MTSDTRTTDDIERDIEDERAQMSDTIHELQKKFSVDAIVSDIGAMFRGQGGDLGRAVSDTVGRNPAAVVLVGVGLAWLFLGRDRTASAASGTTSRHTDRNTRAAMPRKPNDGPFRTDEHHWYGEGQMSRAYRPDARSAKDQASRQPGGADGSNGVFGAVRGAAASVGEAASDAAGAAGHAVSDLTARLSDGLGDLSEDARARVLAARRAAHEARQSSQALMDRGTRAASGFFADQPLVVGALAVALGAAIGGALPHSRIEDDTMGDSSDRLFAEAQTIYREERDKAMAAVRTAASDAKGELHDARAELSDLLPEGKTLGETIVNRTADAAGRVIDNATGGAGNRKPNSTPT
jgi:hypothetical protein